MVEQPDSKPITGSTAAGLSGGTGFAGIVMLLPDNVWKSILLIIAPAITVAISSSWHVVTDEIDARVADWRIRMQRRRAQRLLDDLNKKPGANEALKQQVQDNVDALTMLEVEISKKRVQAIVAS
jgi:hypothetical protein